MEDLAQFGQSSGIKTPCRHLLERAVGKGYHGAVGRRFKSSSLPKVEPDDTALSFGDKTAESLTCSIPVMATVSSVGRALNAVFKFCSKEPDENRYH